MNHQYLRRKEEGENVGRPSLPQHPGENQLSVGKKDSRGKRPSNGEGRNPLHEGGVNCQGLVVKAVKKVKKGKRAVKKGTNTGNQ